MSKQPVAKLQSRQRSFTWGLHPHHDLGELFKLGSRLLLSFWAVQELQSPAQPQFVPCYGAS